MPSHPIREEPRTFAHGPVLAYNPYSGEQKEAMVRVLARDSETDTDKTLQTMEELNQLLDVDGILDKVLLEARQMADADAGTIFLLDKGKLQFSYVQNDTLFKEDATHRMIYADYALPVDEASIVGHVALSGEPLAIDDAYELSSDLPWSFNRSFDQQTGYRTISILTIPLKTYQDRLVGVMQIINARDEMGVHTPFTLEHRKTIPLLANKASAVIDRGLMIREQILRMMRLAAMRDPAETAGHVQRVGAYAAEIYKRYALNRAFKDSASQAFSGNPEGLYESVKRTSGLLRLAAMLHDVGKVGVADAILKKPGRTHGRGVRRHAAAHLEGSPAFRQHGIGPGQVVLRHRPAPPRKMGRRRLPRPNPGHLSGRCSRRAPARGGYPPGRTDHRPGRRL